MYVSLAVGCDNISWVQNLKVKQTYYNVWKFRKKTTRMNIHEPYTHCQYHVTCTIILKNEMSWTIIYSLWKTRSQKLSNLIRSRASTKCNPLKAAKYIMLLIYRQLTADLWPKEFQKSTNKLNYWKHISLGKLN